VFGFDDWMCRYMAPSQAEAQSWSLILTRYEKETPAKRAKPTTVSQGAIASRASHFGVNSETADWLSFLHIDVATISRMCATLFGEQYFCYLTVLN
jgi:hypothetical protein